MTNPLILGSLPSAPLFFIGPNIYWCSSRRAVATPKRVMARPSSAGKGDDFASITNVQPGKPGGSNKTAQEGGKWSRAVKTLIRGMLLALKSCGAAGPNTGIRR